ncbi:MAG TPA: response regulator [Candidatus Angelobacter sp.]|nr:response regulator [Candidatus Angelobacter sp.]
METGSECVLCVADSNVRMNYIARTLKKAGYNVVLSSSTHNAVAIVAISKKLDGVVIDEDLVFGNGSVAESIKAVKPIPILLVCDAGPTGSFPTCVDLVTANGSRQQILAGLAKLLHARTTLQTSA